MELIQIKKKLVEARDLQSEVAEAIAERCAAKTCMAEEDLLTLEEANFMVLRLAETNDSLLFRYSRERFGKDLFAPKAKVIENPVMK